MLIYDIIVFVILISRFVGSVGTLAQRQWVRFAAYSGMSHIGQRRCGLLTNTHTGFHITVIYAIIYVFSAISIWIIMGVCMSSSNYSSLSNSALHIDNIEYNIELDSYLPYDNVVYLTQRKGRYEENIGLMALFNLTMWSIAGIPPMMGFVTKILVRCERIDNNHFLIALSIIIATLFGIYNYLRVIKRSSIDIVVDFNYINVLENKELYFIRSLVNLLRFLGIMEPVGMLIYNII